MLLCLSWSLPSWSLFSWPCESLPPNVHIAFILGQDCLGVQNSCVEQQRGISAPSTQDPTHACFACWYGSVLSGLSPLLTSSSLGSQVSVYGLLCTSSSSLVAPVFWVLLITMVRLWKSLLCYSLTVLMFFASWAGKPNWQTPQGRNWWWVLVSLLFNLLLFGILTPQVLSAWTVSVLLCCPLCLRDIIAQSSEGHWLTSLLWPVSFLAQVVCKT